MEENSINKMEVESIETSTVFSDEDDDFKSVKLPKKAFIKSSDEEDSAADEVINSTKAAGVSSQSDSGVDDCPIEVSKGKKFNRLKRHDSSESDSETLDSHIKKSFIKDGLADIVESNLSEDGIADGDSQKEDPPDKCDDDGFQKNHSPAEKSSYNERFHDDIYDAEGSSDEDNKDKSPYGCADEAPSSPPSEKKKKTKRGKRESKSDGANRKPKESLSEVDEIHKETQRLIRESRVSLPYHIPRQRTLQDFLNRRKTVPKIPLNSTSEDLKVVWKQIEEREKTAESFYNSESDENDSEMISKSEDVTQPESAVVNSEVSLIETGQLINIEGSHSNPETSKNLPDIQLSQEKLGEIKSDLQDIGKVDCSEPISDNLTVNGSAIASFEMIEKSSIDINEKCNNKDDIVMPDKGKYQDNSESIKDNSVNNLVKDSAGSESEFTFFGMSLGDDDTKDNLNTERQITDEIRKVNCETSEMINSSKPLFEKENTTNSLESDLDTSKTNESPDKNEKIKQTERHLPKALLNPVSALKNSNILDKVPTLNCRPGDEIDLDEPVANVNHLLKRFMKHAKWKTVVSKEKEVKLRVVNVESDSGGEVTSMIEEEVTVSSNQEAVPGQRLSALKQSLKKSIDKTRSLLLAKRIEHYKLYEQEFYDETGGESKDVDEDEEFENEMFGDKGSDDGEENANVSEGDDSDEENTDDVDNDEDEVIEEKPEKKKSDFLDEEAEESEDECGEDDRLSDAFSLSEGEEQPGGKKAKKSLSFDDSKASQESTVKKMDLSGLGLDQESGDEGDLVGLCSGKFQTQRISLTQLEADSSQSYDPSTPAVQAEVNPYSQEMFSQRSIRVTKILDSDEEGDETTQAVKLSVNNKRLQFSDDEDDGDTKLQNELKIPEKDEESDDTSDDDSVVGDDAAKGQESDSPSQDGYDSQAEEEIIQDEPKPVFYDSEEEVVEGKKFLDVEAELSGSEWGSEDEDEKGLSDLEVDEADMEKINQRKLRTELERIHMQEIMAEDKREIRLLQELLLEDGELHSDGPKRQRLFRWSNQNDSDGLGGKVALSDEETGPVDEEEEDFQWRKQRLEREQFLNSSRKDDEGGVVDENVSFPVSEKKMLKQQSVPKLQPSLLSSPDPKQPFKLLTNRGSFLKRSEKVLSKLAGLAAPSDQQQRVNRNMVFSVVSPPKAQDQPDFESEKRKADKALPRVTKKLKFNETSVKTSRGIGLLQKLMESDQAS